MSKPKKPTPAQSLHHALTWCEIGARKLRQASEVIALANSPVLAAHYADHARMIEEHVAAARARRAQ